MNNDQTPDSIAHADYDVGYKKPPAATRFQPGQSGNKAGRPKGARNLATEWDEELNEKIIISQGGRKKKISKKRAILKRITQKALEGKDRAAALALQGAMMAEQPSAVKADELGVSDLKILENFKRRVVAEHKAAIAQNDKTETETNDDQ